MRGPRRCLCSRMGCASPLVQEPRQQQGRQAQAAAGVGKPVGLPRATRAPTVGTWLCCCLLLDLRVTSFCFVFTLFNVRSMVNH